MNLAYRFHIYIYIYIYIYISVRQLAEMFIVRVVMAQNGLMHINTSPGRVGVKAAVTSGLKWGTLGPIGKLKAYQIR